MDPPASMSEATTLGFMPPPCACPGNKLIGPWEEKQKKRRPREVMQGLRFVLYATNLGSILGPIYGFPALPGAQSQE